MPDYSLKGCGQNAAFFMTATIYIWYIVAVFYNFVVFLSLALLNKNAK